MSAQQKLNVGCGRNPLPGWINLDAVALPGVDVVADLEHCAQTPLPLSDNSISDFLLSHVLEHIERPLPLMQDLWRVASPGARMVIRVPYGSSDDAYEDPTHARRYFLGSFGYFGQPFYWRADYAYRGDWQPERITLLVSKAKHKGRSPQEIMQRVMTLRNVVQEMIVELHCVKPAREPRRELQQAPEIKVQLV